MAQGNKFLGFLMEANLNKDEVSLLPLLPDGLAHCVHPPEAEKIAPLYFRSLTLLNKVLNSKTCSFIEAESCGQS